MVKDIPSLTSLSREELEEKIQQLEAQNLQLKNILQNRDSGNTKISKKKNQKKKEFDFSRYAKRHILLKFAYLGWDRQGFVVQDDTTNTIEAALFDALTFTKLIESRETSSYHRCGRTDKGVSSFGQVISITVRSSLPTGDELSAENRSYLDVEKELNYPQILNRVLPPDIRVLSWSPVPNGFSARFDCASRTYKYFFPRGTLNLDLMNKAGQLLVGEHDFRNFCKMDVGNGVVTFKRKILSVAIREIDLEEESPAGSRTDNGYLEEESLAGSRIDNGYLEEESPAGSRADDGYLEEESPAGSRTHNGYLEEESPADSRTHNSYLEEESPACSRADDGYRICVATIKGVAFLWHQIRAIMTVLLLIGEGNEEPAVIQKLLDVKEVKRKPQYGLASEVGLNLYDVEYENIKWHYDKDNLRTVISQLQATWAELSTKSSMIHHMLQDLVLCLQDNFEYSRSPSDQLKFILKDPKTKIYKPLLERDTCESLEERVKHFVKRRRLDPEVLKRVKETEINEDDST